jgi:hypothetical protein
MRSCPVYGGKNAAYGANLADLRDKRDVRGSVEALTGFPGAGLHPDRAFPLCTRPHPAISALLIRRSPSLFAPRWLTGRLPEWPQPRKSEELFTDFLPSS